MQTAWAVKRRNAGHNAARKHIREAQEFSEQMGGLDEVVKNYFFSLSPAQTKKVLDAYGAAYGASAQSYAEFALPKWKAKQRTMSGMVAKRLFDCIPPLMPETEKYSLARKLWERYALRQTHRLLIGLSAPLEAVLNLVASYFYGDNDRFIRYIVK